MFERYTDEAKRAIFFARWEAQQHGANCIDTLHLLLGICHDDTNRTNRLLKPHEWYGRFREALCPNSQPARSKDAALPLNREAKTALVRTAEIADQQKEYWIDTCHLLAGLLYERECLAAEQLSSSGFTMQHVLKEMELHPSEFGPPPSWRTRISKRIEREIRHTPVKTWVYLFSTLALLILWALLRTQT